MKTAVEWLTDQLKKQGFLYDLDIEVAKEMEKSQIINARDSTASELMKNMEDVWILGKSEYRTRTPEEYYKETYGK